MSAPLAILIGIEPDIKSQFNDLFGSIRVLEVPLDTKSIREIDPASEPAIIFSKHPSEKDGFSAYELSQLIRMSFQEVPSFLYFKDKEGFKKDLTENNGFDDIFMLPTDAGHLRASLIEIISVSSLGTVQFYRPVKIIDINAGDVLDFDTNIYLPVNRKYVRLTNAGEAMDAAKIDKIKEHHFNTVHVVFDQLGQFYSYMAKRLRAITNSSFGITEKRQRMNHAIREMLTDLFQDGITSYESGQRILKDCSEIVKSYIMQGDSADWYKRIEQVLGQNKDEYSHTGNVSTLAALFSLGTGIGKPEDLALAGLVHDVGLIDLPYEIRTKDPRKMKPDELKEYQKHPLMSVNLIKSKKIILSDHVSKIIQQHHEFVSGDGYPNGIFGDRILKESQLLSIADRFDYLLNGDEDENNRFTPAQAIQIIRDEQGTNPSKFRYQPELLDTVLGLFTQNERSPEASL
jgi:HD-GYP domain-containing protein (c-di-GMP phosphodiesterase class II)